MQNSTKQTSFPVLGASTALTVTNLQSLASSATAGWQSDRISNLVTRAEDYLVGIKLTTANTAPGSDKAMYVWICPWYTTDGGSTWYAASQGTATLPTGSQGTTTIAQPNDLLIGKVLAYTTQQQVVQNSFLLSSIFGRNMPQAFSIIITNFSGAALSTGCLVDLTPINQQIM